MNDYSYASQHTSYESNQQKSGLSTLKIVLIVAGIFGFLFVAAVVGAVYFITQAMTDSDVMKPITANDQLTVLDVPSNWRELRSADQNPEASLQYCNIFAETYGMVLTETKAEVADAVGVPVNRYSLDDYTQLMIDSLAVENFKAGPEQVLTVNGMQARRFRMTTDLDGIPIVYLVTYLESDTHFHQVHCWTLTSREKKNMPTLKKVADSFRER